MINNSRQVLRLFSNQMKNHTRLSSISSPRSDEELKESARRLAAYCAASVSVTGGAAVGYSRGVENSTIIESTAKGMVKGAMFIPVYALFAYTLASFFGYCFTTMLLALSTTKEHKRNRKRP